MSGDVYLGARKTGRKMFQERALCLATVLQQYGVGEDDAVGALLYNDTLYMEVFEACRHLGAHFVTLNWHGSAQELSSILADSGAKVLLGHSNLTAKFAGEYALDIPIVSAAVPPRIRKALGLKLAQSNKNAEQSNRQNDWERLIAKAKPLTTPPLKTRGMMAYTSGSTGQPKGIRRQQDPNRPDAYETFKGLATTLMQLQAGDRFYVAAPLYHSAPNALSSMCLAFGDADLYLSPHFEAEQFLADIERFAVTHCYIVPTMMVRLLKLPADVRNKYDTSSWRFGISTGSAWPSEVKEAMIDWFGPIFYETYGASEIGFMTLISSEESLRKPGSVGKVLPGGSIKIVDEEGKELPAGETGLIYVHLPMFGAFKYSNVEGEPDDLRRGEHVTVGDVGHLDEDDYLYISDRKKDMIISGGVNIFPAEIEAALIKMPQILDCAVFAGPDEEFGEMVIAALQLLPGQTVAQKTVEEFLDGKIARFKIPRKIEIHEQLPREDSGKIFKQKLRAPHWPT